MKKLAIAALLLLPVMGFAGPTLVDNGPVVSIEEYSPASSDFVCTLGNNPPPPHSTYDPFWWRDSQRYAVLFDPADCPTCDLGFAFSRVSMLLHLEPGATFRMSASVVDVIDNGGGCYSPGAGPGGGLGTSSWTDVSGITTIGTYEVSVAWAGPCIDPGRPYFLIFNLQDVSPEFARPILDGNGILPCRSWVYTGQWTDAMTFGTHGGWPGDPIVWAESDCCEAPVSLEDANWGSVKSLFR